VGVSISSNPFLVPVFGAGHGGLDTQVEQQRLNPNSINTRVNPIVLILPCGASVLYEIVAVFVIYTIRGKVQLAVLDD